MGRKQIVSVRAIGLGASVSATVADCVALVNRTLDSCGGGTAMRLATLDRREALGAAVAAELGIELVVFSAGALAAAAVRHALSGSELARRTTGTPSVAEAAALLAAGPAAVLRARRRTGRRCTCALAEMP